MATQPPPSPTPLLAVLDPTPEQAVDATGEAPAPTETPPPPTATPITGSTAEPTDGTAPTTIPDPSPTVEASTQCSVPIEGAAQQVSTVAVDFDGDDAQDQLSVYSQGDGTWRIRVETAAGESLDSPLADDDGSAAGIAALGGADFGGASPGDDPVVVVGSGASALIVAIYLRDGCALVPALINGVAASFPIGGSVGNLSGLQCLDSDGDGSTDSLIAWSGQADFDSADGQYDISGVEYALRGTTLAQLAEPSLTANIREADFVYGQLSCGAINL